MMQNLLQVPAAEKDFRSGKINLRQYLERIETALRRVGVDASIINDKNLGLVLVVKPNRNRSTLNNLAALVAEGLDGTRLLFSGDSSDTSHDSLTDAIVLPATSAILGAPREAAFHEIVHAVHAQMERRFGAHLLSGGLIDMDAPDLDYGRSLSFSELGAFAAEVRLRTLRLSEQPASEMERKSQLDELRFTIRTARELAERSRQILTLASQRALNIADMDLLKITTQAHPNPDLASKGVRIAVVEIRLENHPELSLHFDIPELRPLLKEFRGTHLPGKAEQLKARMWLLLEKQVRERIQNLSSLSANLVRDYTALEQFLDTTDSHAPEFGSEIQRLGRNINLNVSRAMRLAP